MTTDFAMDRHSITFDLKFGQSTEAIWKYFIVIFINSILPPNTVINGPGSKAKQSKKITSK